MSPLNMKSREIGKARINELLRILKSAYPHLTLCISIGAASVPGYENVR
jgi:hypothetical protein